MITNGLQYKYVANLKKEDREEEVNQILNRGNQKLAEEENKKVQGLIDKEVKHGHGFFLPVPLSILPKVKNGLVQPICYAKQWTLAGNGDRSLKGRLTKEISFNTLEEEERSVNARLDLEKYPEPIYGGVLSRIIHYIVSLRLKYPSTSIFIQKTEFADAFRRVTLLGRAAA